MNAAIICWQQNENSTPVNENSTSANENSAWQHKNNN